MKDLFINSIVILIKYFFYITELFYIHTGFAIILLSVIMKILLAKPEKIINNYTDKKLIKFNKIKLEVKKETKNFKGENKFNITQNIYKKNKYNPFYETVLIFPYLIQLPVFLGIFYSFKYLNFELFTSKSFFFISDLSSPDNIFYFASFNINFLPILMTLINICAVFQSDNKHNNGILDYLVPLLFLLILYQQASAIVLYWTCNNIINLIFIISKKYFKRFL